MYEEYFGLKKKPFSIVPDPGYFFTSTGHREALAHLLYAIKSDGGFALLTGEVGTGKTTVCRRLLEMMPEDTEVALILNPKVTSEELLASVCDEFQIAYPEGTTSIKVLVERIYRYLLKIRQENRRAVLIIEEAQNLSPEVLEQIRLLTNLETNEEKLLQMIMLGQPELREMLDQPELRQLSQRITARYHLGSLSKEDVPEYVNYRLSMAGLLRGHPFPRKTLNRLCRLSAGVPRLINVICDRALLGAYVQGKDLVDVKTLNTAAREVAGETGGERRNRLRGIEVGISLVLVCGALGAAFYLNRPAVMPTHVSHAGAANQIKKEALRRPSGYNAAASRTVAQAALFRQWQITYDPKADISVCQQAEAQGLRCLEAKGSIIDLKETNKPVVLKLIDEDKSEFYATLIGLSGEAATFVVGKETKTVDAGEIAQHWTGDYQLLWKAPAEYTGEMRPGAKGPLVPWLSMRLARAQGLEAPAKSSQSYDDDLIRQVMRFQLVVGMLPDGIVGPKTVIRLNGLSARGEPDLRIGKGGG